MVRLLDSYLMLLVQLYDAEAERFQEWQLSSHFFPSYVRLLYLAANPVLAHPLYDLYDEGDSSDEEEATGSRAADDGQPMSPEAKATAAFAAAQHGENRHLKRDIIRASTLERC